MSQKRVYTLVLDPSSLHKTYVNGAGVKVSVVWHGSWHNKVSWHIKVSYLCVSKVCQSTGFTQAEIARWLEEDA